ncbi:MAG: SURF1 family protein [Pseudomonadota bacterium]
MPSERVGSGPAAGSRGFMTRGRRLAFLATFGAGGLAALLWLGFWQLDRLEWKRGLIAEMEARAAGPALALSGEETAGPHEHRAAQATGRYDPTVPQVRYLTSIKGVGPGFRLIAAFELENGRRVLVDRGFAPEQAAPRGGETPALPSGPQTLTGRLRWPSEISAFTPEPNRTDFVWFARDVPSLAAALDTAPVLLVLTPENAARGGEAAPTWPKPAPVGVELPNNHLGYAVTWFAMAVIWLAMSLVLGFRSTA